MILKNADDRSADLAALRELLEEAASPRQRALVQDQIDNLIVGQKGEREVAYFLNHHLRDSERTIVIHDLRLEVDGEVAQIDHLVIQRYLRNAIVIESKSHRARLKCNAAGEWTAWYGRKPVPIASPIQQAKRHVTTLKRWLKAEGITDIAEFWPLVVIGADMHADVASTAKAEVSVVRADLIAEWWGQHFDETVGALKAVSRLMTRLSHDELVALGNRLVAGHQPAAFDWRAKLGFPPPPMVSAPVASAALRILDAAPQEFADSATDRVAIPSPRGPVTAIRLPDGDYALRHGQDDAMIEFVKSIAKGRGYWNGRYRNWIIPGARFPEVRSLLQASQPPSAPAQ
jgi:hypothetical protein